MKVLTLTDGLDAIEVIPFNATAGVVLPAEEVAAAMKQTIAAFDVGTLAASSGTTVAIPVPGALTGDGVIVNPSPLLPDTIFLVQMHVSGPDAVSVVFFNIDVVGLDPGPIDFIVTLFR